MDYLELARDMMSKASAGGAEAEAIIIESQTTNIEVGRGQVEQLSQAVSKGLGLRVIEGGRVGYAYTSDFGPESLEETGQAAQALAQSADADQFRALPETKPVPEEELEIFDPDFEGVTTEAKVEFLLTVERTALAYDPRVVASVRCVYQDGLARVYLANSRGFSGWYQRSGGGSFIMAVARDEEGQTMGTGFDASVFYRELDPEKIGREAGRKAVEILGGKPVETQEISVVMDPTVGAEFLAFLAQALTAEAMQRGRSFLIDKMGATIGTELVNLVDNGRLRRGLASAPFDGEGVPTTLTRLIKAGVLERVIYDTYTARKDGISSTGNAGRGSHRSLPSLGPTNFYLEPSDTPPEEIMAGVERGLYVTNTMGLAGINPVSGDYSVGASGLWIEHGQLTKPVTAVTVAATMLDMLGRLTAVGNDLRFVPMFGSVGSPTIRIDGMVVAGK